MKLSYNWLKQYVDIDVSPEDLSPILTDIGLEVEGFEKVHTVKGGLEGIVIGEVMTCEKHSNADKLSVTTVNVGSGDLLPIVCGAPNVASGQKVLVATVGTTLYADEESFQIKKAKIRGEVSEGMICAEDELGLGKSHEGIMILPDDAEVGKPAKEYFNITEDYVYEIGLTPNRADAASHIGAARDIAAGLNRLNNTRRYKLELPSVDQFAVENHNLDIPVIVEDTAACPRYAGVTISGVKVTESPDWIKNRLNSIGLRPINNIVDVTNFVLHETGQPLHAFDADKILGGKVIIKKLPKDTPFITLDEEERKLHADDLMICNEKEGMCIGGVFGGISSGVTEKTVNIFLESAYFDPAHIRKTARRHGLQTDASFRFERGADPNITAYALKRAAQLFKEIAGGVISSEIKDVYPSPIQKWQVDISYHNVDRLIGKKIERETIKDILKDLEIEIITESEDGLQLLIPTYKVDVTREADVIEEILRIYGYNNVEFSTKTSISVSPRQKPDLEKLQNLISDQLTGKGFVEMMNNSITRSGYYIDDEKPEHQVVRLLNPLSQDLDVMRRSMLYGGLEVIAYNSNRKINDQKLYEFGNIYWSVPEKVGNPLDKYFEEKHLVIFMTGKKRPDSWNTNGEPVDFYELKGIVEGVFKKLGVDMSKMKTSNISNKKYILGQKYLFKNEHLATIAKINAEIQKDFDLKHEVYYADINWDCLLSNLPEKENLYRPVPRYPSVKRDLALVVDVQVNFDELKASSVKAAGNLLKSVHIFDVYEGDKIPQGKKSYALSFTLQDEAKTLTDKVIEKTIRKIQQQLKHDFNAELR